MKQFLLIFLFYCMCISASFSASMPKPLPGDNAFQFSATAENNQTILLNWIIAPNYYLYQKHFRFRVIQPASTVLGNPLFPSDSELLKTSMGAFTVYSHSPLSIPIPLIQSKHNSLLLEVHYQGCSKAGYCYPPTTKIVSINLADTTQPASTLNIDIAPITPSAHTPLSNKFDRLLTEKPFFLIMLGFLIFGILLSLTPCVLPMIPILSSMIIGKNKMTHTHSFFLSLFYVLGMAITYAIAGMIFGSIGSNVQTFFQQPWIIVCFSVLFIAMALSLFGLYSIQLPEKLRSMIAKKSHHQKRGTYFGAAVMGCLSTLILSPCVTPPLVAVLGFISQSGDAALGGMALFAMGIGMGVPLLLIGALGPSVLPKSGAWMNTIKNITGILLLAVALFMLQRIVPPIITHLLWASLCLGIALYFGALSTASTPWMMVRKIIGILFFIFGILLIVNTFFQHLNKPCQPKPMFQTVHSLSAVQAALDNAKQHHQWAMLDFSADWCIACQELASFTFQNPAVQQQLTHFVLLRADVTQNSSDNQALKKQYDVVAPPTILFFKDGKEISKLRIIGYVSAKQFLKQLIEINAI